MILSQKKNIFFVLMIFFSNTILVSKQNKIIEHLKKNKSPLNLFIKKKMQKPRCSMLVNLTLNGCFLASWQELVHSEFSNSMLRFYQNYEISLYVAGYFDFFSKIESKKFKSHHWKLISKPQNISSGDIVAYVPLRYRSGNSRPDKGNHIVFIEKIIEHKIEKSSHLIIARVFDSVMTSNHHPLLKNIPFKRQKELLKFETSYNILNKKRALGSGLIRLLLNSKAKVLAVQAQLGGKWKKRKGFIARPKAKAAGLCSEIKS